MSTPSAKDHFESAKRLLKAKDHEAAALAFQNAASADRRFRVPCMEGMAVCYLALDQIDAAIRMLRDAISSHPLHDDPLALSLKFLLMNALARQADNGQ